VFINSNCCRRRRCCCCCYRRNVPSQFCVSQRVKLYFLCYVM